MGMSGASLIAKDVTVRAGDRAILDRVSITVNAGEFVVVVGPNGAGKSTLLRVLAGEAKPTRGAVQLDGRAIADIPTRELGRIRAVLPQQSRIEFAFSVRDVVAMGRAPWRGRPEQDNDMASIEAALAAADITQLADRDVTTLSGGEAGRVTLARVLAQDTPLIMLDEPTAALDIAHQETVLRHARSLADRGVGVLAILHDLNAAARFADRVMVLHDGIVSADGPPGDVLTPALLSKVYGHEIEVHRILGRRSPVVLPAETNPISIPYITA